MALQAKLDQYEKQESEKVEEKLSEALERLNTLKERLNQTNQENQKLRLMYEVEKDSLADATEEIEFLRKALADLNSPVPESTVYDQ
jgi:archaellum component FlaC